VLIGRLRRHLGDDAREPELIKTVRGRGYMLAARVTALR
jgi:two-component system OmpR family response regulator